MNQGTSDILFVFLSGSFFVIGPMAISQTQHGIKGQCGTVRDSRIFLEKLPLGKYNQEWSKMPQKWVYSNV